MSERQKGALALAVLMAIGIKACGWFGFWAVVVLAVLLWLETR